MKINFFKLFRENKYPVYINILERAFFFIVFLIIARVYPSDSYGQLITIFSLANIFVIIFDLGIPLLIQKELSSGNKVSNNFTGNAIAISIALFPVYLFLLWTYQILFFPEFPFWLFASTAVLVYLFSFSNLLNKALSGIRNFYSQYRALLYSRVLTLCAILIFSLLFNADLTFLILLLTVGAIIHITGLLISLKNNNVCINPLTARFKIASRILKMSVPLGLAVLFNFLYDKIDIILISKLTDFENVAFYNIGYSVYKSSSLLYSFLFITGLSRISYLSKNKKAVRLFYKKYLFILLPVCLVSSLILYFFGGILISILYTDKFSGSEIILRILSFAVIGLALNNLTGVILNGLGMFRQNMNVTLAGLILNILLNIFFIPVYGIAGAAVITVFTEYFIFAGDYLYLKKFKIL